MHYTEEVGMRKDGEVVDLAAALKETVDAAKANLLSDCRKRAEAAEEYAVTLEKLVKTQSDAINRVTELANKARYRNSCSAEWSEIIEALEGW
jgi:hypothetical protein